MTTIPASELVAVTPSVLAAGGNALDMTGLVLDNGTRVPIGTVADFPDADAVGDYFGTSSDMATKAAVYFAGFDNSLAKPGSLKVAQYNQVPVAAYLRGSNVSALTLAQLQALNGTVNVTIDGVLKTASVNLSAATSFSNAGNIIGFALGITGPQVASVTGSIATTTLTVTAVGSGVLAVGDVISGSGVTAGTYITALGTGTGGTGTYTVSASQTVGSTTISAFLPGVSYDSVFGAFIVSSGTTGASSTISYASGGAIVTSLGLTLAAGAVRSQGAAAATPAAFMTALVGINQNWAAFMLAFDPDVSGNANKLLFAGWTSTQNNRWAFVCWDTDASPTTTVPATSSLGYLITQANYSGTILVYEPTDLNLAAFVLGAIASIDFEATNGRTNLAFRGQAGLTTTASDATVASNLRANGYNYYGAYATANDAFNLFFPGKVSGPFVWADSYVNQIWLNNAFQLALLTLLQNSLSIPYNAAGNALIEQALADAIEAAVNFGAIRAGVTLSASQVAAVNAAAGRRVDGVLNTRGWYLLVGTASPTVRQARGSPPCTFFYMDGESVQTINLSSIVLQ